MAINTNGQLKSLSQKFKNLRVKRKNRILRYPEDLKREALTLLGLGLSRDELSSSLGISSSSIHKWFHDIKLNATKELQIVESVLPKKRLPENKFNDEGVVKVTLPNGVVLQVSCATFSMEFVSALARVKK